MSNATAGRVEGVVWDWGDTLMKDQPGQEGPMVRWPHVEAMPGAAEALSAFSRMKVQCVATNAVDSSSSMVAAALGRVGLADHLVRFFTSNELGVSKPDPAFFEAVCRNLDIDPSRLLSVGNDLVKDILPAKAIGMTTVLVAPGGPSAGDGAADGPDYVVSDLTELALLVEGGEFRSSTSNHLQPNGMVDDSVDP